MYRNQYRVDCRTNNAHLEVDTSDRLLALHILRDGWSFLTHGWKAGALDPFCAGYASFGQWWRDWVTDWIGTILQPESSSGAFSLQIFGSATGLTDGLRIDEISSQNIDISARNGVSVEHLHGGKLVVFLRHQRGRDLHNRLTDAFIEPSGPLTAICTPAMVPWTS